MNCESCGMPIEAGPLCQYCATPDGALKPFDEIFERFVQWSLSQGQSADRAAAEVATRAHMRTMPAWKDHPALAS